MFDLQIYQNMYNFTKKNMLLQDLKIYVHRTPVAATRNVCPVMDDQSVSVFQDTTATLSHTAKGENVQVTCSNNKLIPLLLYSFPSYF